ncbi:MAG: hypothetical protein ACFFAH_17035 [Promethearchaeota archaeon]
MQNKKIVKEVKDYIEKQIQNRKSITSYKFNQNPTPSNYFKKFNIKIELDGCKEIILQEETRLELGGINKQSFSIIYPTLELEFIKNGKITLIGKEINDIYDSSVDFGMFILIGAKKLSEKDKNNLRQFNFISNGIEGFIIRSIPRRFWCRISTEVIKKNFSFEFLGNAIMYLYKQKFDDLIESIEILFINSYPNIITKFIKLTSEIREQISAKWKKKIEEWKKKIDCDYDWACEICPYKEDCYIIKETLVEREQLDEREGT